MYLLIRETYIYLIFKAISFPIKILAEVLQSDSGGVCTVLFALVFYGDTKSAVVLPLT